MNQEHHNSGRRFRVWLAIVLLFPLLVAVLYFALRAREPVYQGKTSAEWFREFQAASSHYWVPVSKGSLAPSNVRTFDLSDATWYFRGSRRLDSEALRRDRAADGLRALGTNAALYLGREFAREDGALARDYSKLYLKAPPGVKRLLPGPPRPRSLLRMEIGWALEALGEKATPAVPALLSTLRNGDPLTVQTALRLLKNLRFDQRALEPILEELTRKGNYTRLLLVITDQEVQTAGAAACLARVLKASDPVTRRSCLNALEHLGAAGVVALPELIAAVKDPDDEIRYGAACALGAIGTGAGPAIPDLIQATNDTSVMVQRASARALRKIQGQVEE